MKAFPRADGKFDSSKTDEKGMDLRDYFAAKAMQEFVSEMPLYWAESTIVDINKATKFAYKVADAMMEARK